MKWLKPTSASIAWQTFGVVILLNLSMVHSQRLTATNWRMYAGQNQRRFRSVEKIHFPDSSMESNAPECKKQNTFCNEIDNYPVGKIHDLIKKSPLDIQSFFGVDLPEESLSQRFSGPDGETLCDSRVQQIYPKSSPNRNGSWELIVNTDEYKQGIVIETCTSTEPSPMARFPSTYTPECRQKYIYRPLVTFKNNELSKDYFKIPTCCQFFLKSTRDDN